MLENNIREVLTACLSAHGRSCGDCPLLEYGGDCLTLLRNWLLSRISDSNEDCNNTEENN